MTPRQTLDRILLTHTEPRDIETAWMYAMMATFDAQAASAYGARFDPSTGHLHMTHVHFHGTPEFERVGTMVEGVSIDDRLGVQAEDVVEMNAATVVQDEELPETMVEQLWRPFGIHSGLSINGLEDGAFTGNFNVFRVGHAPRFTPADAQRPAWIRQTLRMLGITDALFRQGGLAQRTVALYRSNGEPWLANCGRALHEGWAADWIGAEIEALPPGPDAEATRFQRHLRARLTRVIGDGDEGILVEVSPMLAITVGRFLKMSRSRRKVAAHAATGATVNDIAAAMSRSPETVRSHLKVIYDELGIGSRAELAALYETALRPAE